MKFKYLTHEEFEKKWEKEMKKLKTTYNIDDLFIEGATVFQTDYPDGTEITVENALSEEYLKYMIDSVISCVEER